MIKNRTKASGAGGFKGIWIERLTKLAEIGTSGYPLAVRRQLMAVNLTAFMISIFSVLYALLFAFYDFEKYQDLVVANLLPVSIALIIPYMHRFGEISAALALATVEYIGLFFFVQALGHDSGVQINFLVGAAIPFAIFGRSRLLLVISAIVVGLIMHMVTWFMFPPERALVILEPALLKILYVSSVVTTGTVIAVIVLYAFTLADRARAEADNLLANVLPHPVAERLKSKPGTRIADSVPEASVMFTDLVGFTPLAQKLGAEKTLNILDEIFTEFDKLVFEEGVEKIKTIGDGYMAVCGVIEPLEDHASRLANVTLQLPGIVKRISEKHGMNLEIRIGMAIGPVMAGVIGTNKFSYDVWGETVNLASRLESHGLAGEVHISTEVVQALGTSFSFKPRGPINIKGIGSVETWLLQPLDSA
jgi:adenylate cyclase